MKGIDGTPMTDDAPQEAKQMLLRLNGRENE